MVRFDTNPERFASVAMLKKLESSVKESIKLDAQILAMDEEIIINPVNYNKVVLQISFYVRCVRTHWTKSGALNFISRIILYLPFTMFCYRRFEKKFIGHMIYFFQLGLY